MECWRIDECGAWTELYDESSWAFLSFEKWMQPKGGGMAVEVAAFFPQFDVRREGDRFFIRF
jgi:hypothetical protein